MKYRAVCLRGFALLCVCGLLAAGCGATGSGPTDEQKEPYYLAGKERVITLDYKGAIECFEKALQVNPKSAAAHFELGCIYDSKEPDPAAAIYHYQKFLSFAPHAETADLARQHIMTCKQALAETVQLGPVTEKVQRQLEQVTEENKKLKEQNKQLLEDLEKWSSYAARLQTLTNSTVAVAAPVAATQTNVPPVASGTGTARRSSSSSSTTSANTAAGRTHTVKSGETPSLIARRYGVKLDALLSANPNLDPRRLRVGQTVRIPSS